MKQIGVQKIFWDAFELAVSVQAKRLAKDIADALGQDAAPLLAELKNEKVSVYLFDESDSGNSDPLEMRCKHCIPIANNPAWRTPCLEPVLWSANPAARTNTCLHHSLNPELRDPKWREMIAYKYDDIAYYIDQEDHHVYDEEGVLCGRYDPVKNKIIVFDIAVD